MKADKYTVYVNEISDPLPDADNVILSKATREAEKHYKSIKTIKRVGIEYKLISTDGTVKLSLIKSGRIKWVSDSY